MEGASGRALPTPRRLWTAGALAMAAWTAVVGGSAWVEAAHVRRETLETARTQARAAFEKDAAYRRWNARSGGVYAPVSAETPPDEYLADVPERDILTPSGRTLTLVPHTTMVRGARELEHATNGNRAHSTSLGTIRPEDAADTWESRALQAFVRGETEISEIVQQDNREYLRLMRPLATEKECLGCHAAQGFRLGDLRGGTSVTVDLAPLRATEREGLAGLLAVRALLWALGLGVIGASTRRLGRSLQARNAVEAEVLARNTRLSVLYEIARAATESLDPTRVLTLSLEATLRALDVESGLFYLLDDDGRAMTMRVHRGISEQFAQRASRIDLGDGLSGKAVSDGKPVVIGVEDYPTQRLADVMASEGWKSLASTPLIAESKAIGALTLASRRPQAFQKDDMELLASVGHQLGMAVRNAQLHQEIERDLAERKTLQDQLIQAQKLEAVGRLAGGIAHDFNNILSVINSYAGFVAEGIRDGNAAMADIDEIIRAGRRAADLTRQILAFSRRQVLLPRVVDLNAAIISMEKLLRRLIGEDIELVTVPGGALGMVKVDPGQIEQVIMNLAVNARDAMPHGGRLTLETVNVELDDEFTKAHVGARTGPHVMLRLSDTGSGMDAHTLAHVFEPFFTTKTQGMGTGLGLSIIHGIVLQSGGSIFVTSAPGRGTTFRIYLPRVDAVPDAPVLFESAAAGARCTETILLVEDDGSVRAVARQILKRKGYDVHEACGSEEAHDVSRRVKGPIHLLLTDIVMPLGDGRDLARQLVAQRREMKVLYMSGYSDNAVFHHDTLDAGVAFLQKPFAADVLARKVREVLDGPAPAT